MMKRVNFSWVIGALLVALVLAACGGDKKEGKKSYTVGIVDAVPIGGEMVNAFKAKMGELGYTEGENITYFVGVNTDSLSEQVSADKIDLLVVANGIFGGGPTTPLIKAKEFAAGKIPILVAPAIGEPVQTGDAESLKHPGKNITGLVMLSLDAKRFEVFVDMLPEGAKRIAVIYGPDSIYAADELTKIESVAEQDGIELLVLSTPSSQPESTDQAFAEIPDDVDGIFLLKVWGTAPQWFEWAYAHGIPSSQDSWVVGDVMQPLMSYGPSSVVVGEQAATFADHILKRSKPGDLPMQYVDFVLKIDLGVAEGINFEVPEEILRQANEIVRSDPSLFVTQSPAAASGTPIHPEGTGACAAQQITMAGTFTVCITATCDTLLDSGVIKYTDRVEVASCTAENLVGTCSTAAFNINYYSGDVAPLKMGCGFQAGAWTSAQE